MSKKKKFVRVYAITDFPESKKRICYISKSEVWVPVWIDSFVN